jgi:hypothetical protein
LGHDAPEGDRKYFPDGVDALHGLLEVLGGEGGEGREKGRRRDKEEKKTERGGEGKKEGEGEGEGG